MLGRSGLSYLADQSQGQPRPFGLLAGQLFPSAVPSKLMTMGPHRGHIPPEDHGQQRTVAVDQPCSSARPLGHNRRSSEHPGSPSHGGSQVPTSRARVQASGPLGILANQPIGFANAPRSSGCTVRRPRRVGQRLGAVPCVLEPDADGVADAVDGPRAPAARAKPNRSSTSALPPTPGLF
jgi:hypothetical protein